MISFFTSRLYFNDLHFIYLLLLKGSNPISIKNTERKSFKIFIIFFYELLLFENILIFVNDKGMI